MIRPEIRPELRRTGPCSKKILILEEGIERAQPESKENPAGHRSACFACFQNLRAGRALGEFQVLVLIHNQLLAQRHHEKNTQKAADQRQDEDARIFQVKAQENKRRQREDDACGNRLAGVAGRLDDDVFQNRAAPKGAQNADGQYGNRNRRSNRKASLKTDINGNGSKDDSKERAKQNGAKGKLRTIIAGRNKRFKSGWLNVGHGKPPKALQAILLDFSDKEVYQRRGWKRQGGASRCLKLSRHR